MKKQLLFAAMLTLAAAPASAQFLNDDTSETVETSLEQAMYNLIDSIDTSVLKLQETYNIIQQKDPENSMLSALEYNIQLLKGIKTKAQSKYDAGTLTVQEVADYMTKVTEYAKIEEDAIEKAEIETYQVLVSQKYMSVSTDLNEALANVSEAVQNYYVGAFYLIEADLSTAYNKSLKEDITKKELSDIYDEIIAISAKVESLSDAAEAANSFVEKINANLEVLDSEIEKVKADFPEYDLTYTLEDKATWESFVKEFAEAPAEIADPYTAEDIANLESRFDTFIEESSNLYNQAQLDEYIAQYNAVYYPLYMKISNYMEQMTEFSDVQDDYVNSMNALSEKLGEIYNSLYLAKSMTQKEFDAILTQVKDIEAEADNIFNAAQFEEYLAMLNETYYPAYSEISALIEKVSELADVQETYIPLFYGLQEDLSQEYSNFMGAESLTKEEVDDILAAMDAIVKKANNLYEEAKSVQELIATGINGISSNVASSLKVYTLDGKAVKSLNGKKGIFVVNGKKVILK